MARGNRPAFEPPGSGFALDDAHGKIFGVCAGIGRYMRVDPMIVRLVFVLGAIFGLGTSVVIYLAIALIAD